MNSPSIKKSLDELSQKELFNKISEICSAVTSAITAKTLLEISLKKTMEIFGANRGSIFILSDDGKELILKIAKGMKVEEQENMVKRLGEGVVGKVAEMKQPVIVENIAEDSRFQDYKPRNSYRTPSFICAPLMVKDSLIGVINIADKGCGTHFSKDELQLLDFLASQIALNYRRTQLYQKFKHLVRESQNLKDELGKTSEVTNRLMKQVLVQDRLASIGKLAGGIAHELNNPLDGVLRYINLSLEHLKEDDIIRGYLLEAKQGLNRMVNIVRSLLACSRNTPLSKTKINLNDAVQEALIGIQSEIFHKSIHIQKDLGNDLAPINDLGLERVISNLVRNAIDAVEQKGEITISTRCENDALVLKVNDNGCGIPQESVEKIFEPFYTTKDIDKGCGLGLTIVSEIVKAYSGTIAIDSEPKKGTTFTITLPTKITDKTIDVEKAFRI